MYSSLIGKVQKAQLYAQEKERVIISSFKATFQGEHDSYEIRYDEGVWYCSCKNFGENGFCSHTMAVERIMEGMVPEDAPVSG